MTLVAISDTQKKSPKIPLKESWGFLILVSVYLGRFRHTVIIKTYTNVPWASFFLGDVDHFND